MLPLVVISELEGKRHHPELGWFAREALRLLDDLRLRHGRLDSPISVGDLGGTLHVELNHSDQEVLPSGFRTDSNDARILACALNLAAEGRDVTLVTKDMPLRVKAGSVGLQAEEYRAHDVTLSGWTGMSDLDVRSVRWSTACSRRTSSTPPCSRTWRTSRNCPATPVSGCWRARRARWAG